MFSDRKVVERGLFNTISIVNDPTCAKTSVPVTLAGLPTTKSKTTATTTTDNDDGGDNGNGNGDGDGDGDRTKTNNNDAGDDD